MAPVDGYRQSLAGHSHGGGGQEWAVFCSKCRNEVLQIVAPLPNRLSRHTCGGQLDAVPVLVCGSCNARIAFFSGETLRSCHAGRHEPQPSYEQKAG
ncbi:hypothetical protein [Lentzea sp. HUAS12]|uniref:hypothetical protein n=1 Tax=Lentzea sp. HUAS12 TaxID=2951806 RepID=UPI00209D455E|nr:hypothetical protein [Lentzea sp. HUAS12]USX52484.1 hypothetical protein ND450_45470 [Lentzea sp. HUAS12]